MVKVRSIHRPLLGATYQGDTEPLFSEKKSGIWAIHCSEPFSRRPAGARGVCARQALADGIGTDHLGEPGLSRMASSISVWRTVGSR